MIVKDDEHLEFSDDDGTRNTAELKQNIQKD